MKKPPVTIDSLDLFTRVAEFGSISAAARLLNISSSLATRKLASLERSLNTTLFHRTTRSVRLTEGGMIALKWAKGALDVYGEVTDDLASMERRPSGLIRIALSDYAGLAFLAPFLAEFKKTYPDIRFSVTTTDDLVNPVKEGYDVALHSGRIPDSSLVGIQLKAVQRVLCASPEYLKRREPLTSLDQLAEHDCLVHRPTEPVNWFFRRGKRLIAQPINQYISVDSYLMLIELARNGLGIMRISQSVVSEDVHAGRLVQVLPDYQCVSSTGALPGLWLIYPGRRMPHRTRLFVDALKRHLQKVLI